jgi:hypothetical protein
MTDFAIDPPIRILGRRGTFVRSTEQAAAFMREHMLQHVEGDAMEVLRRLEDVRSAEEARDAAAAFSEVDCTARDAGPQRFKPARRRPARGLDVSNVPAE